MKPIKRVLLLLVFCLSAFLTCQGSVFDTNDSPGYVKRTILRQDIMCEGGYWSTFTCEHNLAYGESLVFVDYQQGGCTFTYSIGNITWIPIGAGNDFPSGTETYNFSMPAFYNQGGAFVPKSTITVGVKPDLTISAVANGNQWFHAPNWLNDYMTNPEWMWEYDPAEELEDTMVFGFLAAGPALPHLLRGIVTLARNPGAVQTAADAAILTTAEATALVNVYLLYVGQQVLLRRQPGLTMSYVTYEKYRPSTGQIYAGRTAGKGTPMVVLARRDAAHLVVRPDFDAAIIQSSTVWDGLSDRGYAGMRGREQQVIDFHRDRARSTDVFEFSANVINGVSPSNTHALTYWLSSNYDFGELTDYRGYTTLGQVAEQQRVPLAAPFSRTPLGGP